MAKRKLHIENEISSNTQIFFGRDESNPQEFNELLKPLFCELCNIHLNSVKSAQIHYESKAHDKHVTNWIFCKYTEKGLPAPKIKRFVEQTVDNATPFHCELCDLPLTSLKHAQQHYNGKRHKLVVKKQLKPSGAGYNNEEGKWVRTGTKTNLEPINDRYFGIGESFRNVDINCTPDSTNNIVNSLNNTANTICTICNVTVTSSSQMKMHLQGAKHLKKLKDFGLPANDKNDTIMANLYKDTPPTDLSIFRTPSGCYYCKICNITVTDETTLKTHLVGKKHLKAAATEMENNITQ